MKKIIIIISFMSLPLTNVLAYENEIKIENNGKRELEYFKNINDLNFKELEDKIYNLEIKLSNYNKLHSDYKQIVYWVIGLIVGLFGGIVFLNWFQAFKLGKQEIDNIKQKIKNDNYEKINIIEKELKENYSIFKKDIENKNNKILEDSKEYTNESIYEIQQYLYEENKNKSIDNIIEKLKLDLFYNCYNIDYTLDDLEEILKNNKLDSIAKINLKEFLEEFNNNYIEKYGTDKLFKMEQNKIKGLIKDYL